MTNGAQPFLQERLWRSKRRVWASQSQVTIREAALGATDATSADTGASAETPHPTGHGNGALDGGTIRQIESDRGRIFDTWRQRICFMAVEPARTAFFIQVKGNELSQMEKDVNQSLDKTFASRGASRHVDHGQSTGII